MDFSVTCGRVRHTSKSCQQETAFQKARRLQAEALAAAEMAAHEGVARATAIKKMFDSYFGSDK
jgi:hypothetical protein